MGHKVVLRQSLYHTETIACEFEDRLFWDQLRGKGDKEDFTFIALANITLLRNTLVVCPFSYPCHMCSYLYAALLEFEKHVQLFISVIDVISRKITSILRRWLPLLRGLGKAEPGDTHDHPQAAEKQTLLHAEGELTVTS